MLVQFPARFTHLMASRRWASNWPAMLASLYTHELWLCITFAEYPLGGDSAPMDALITPYRPLAPFSLHLSPISGSIVQIGS